MTDLDDIRARHVPERSGDDPTPDDECITDGDIWPCDTAIVLAALDMLVPITADRERERDAAIERERRLRQDFETAAGITYDLWLTVTREATDA